MFDVNIIFGGFSLSLPLFSLNTLNDEGSYLDTHVLYARIMEKEIEKKETK